MSLNALVRLPNSNTSRRHNIDEDGLMRQSLFKKIPQTPTQYYPKGGGGGGILVVKAKGKRSGGQSRQFQRPPLPPMPKIEEDGNPRFVIFIRMANVFSLSLTLYLYMCSYSLSKFNLSSFVKSPPAIYRKRLQLSLKIIVKI